MKTLRIKEHQNRGYREAKDDDSENTYEHDQLKTGRDVDAKPARASQGDDAERVALTSEGLEII